MNKLTELSALIPEKDPDIIIITESWTNPDITNGEILLDGYKLSVRKDREDTQNGRGGGLLIYQREQSKCAQIELSPTYHQSGGIRLSGLDLFGFYRSPNCSEEDDQKINSLIKNINTPSVIIGDFNHPGVDWESEFSSVTKEKEFIDATVEGGFTQIVNQPTHDKGNLLDLVLTNVPYSVTRVEIDKENKISDHYLLEVTLVSGFPKAELGHEVLNLKDADLVSMYNSLGSVDWDALLSHKSTEEAWETFKNIFFGELY